MDIVDVQEYKDGELVLEYTDIYDYPRYVLYYDSPQMISIDGPKDEEYEMIAEFDSRFFDAGMVKTVMEYLQTRQ